MRVLTYLSAETPPKGWSPRRCSGARQLHVQKASEQCGIDWSLNCWTPS